MIKKFIAVFIVLSPNLAYASCDIPQTEKVLTSAYQQKITFDTVSHGTYQSLPVCQGTATLFGAPSIITWMNNRDGSVTVINDNGTMNKFLPNGNDSAMGSAYKSIYGSANQQAQLLQNPEALQKQNQQNDEQTREKHQKMVNEVVAAWKEKGPKCEKILAQPNTGERLLGAFVGDGLVRDQKKVQACSKLKNIYTQVVQKAQEENLSIP